MTGMIKFAAINPPAIKQIVATKEGHCRFDKPIIECPEVHPPAYLVPKPTRKPPVTINKNPCTENKLFQLKSSGGTNTLKLVTPCCRRSLTRRGFKETGSGLLNHNAHIIPPITMPATKNKFQISLFQLYLKNGILPGKHAAQICLNEEDTPNDLLPRIKSNGTINPIKGPPTNHGHGACNHFENDMVAFLKKFKAYKFISIVALYQVNVAIPAVTVLHLQHRIVSI
jgi:hypothetical protein